MLTSSGTELGQSHYIREARCCGEETMVLKKGPWSLEEDMKLTAYINKYGVCNWRRIPEAAGLSRCGKSCRIRWINYLDPQVKRGNFTCEEDETIARMHKVLGNKWSEIAAALPGRTNNEIKNHWHASLSKRLKREVIEQSQASSTMIDDSNIDLAAHHHFPDMTGKSVAVDLGILGDDQNHCNNPVTDFMEAPPSGGYDQDPNQQPKKKPFCHPTQDQEMEVFFIECLYPDYEQKTELAKRLSLAPSQVKFWFQKKLDNVFQQNTFDTHHFKDMTQETPEHKSPVNLGDDEDHSNKSGAGIMETPSGDYNQVSNQLLKKKWARHSQLQIEELEAFFYECPDPDDRQRKELSSRLSLGPLQVQSWFQQKRIQVKAKLERRENVQLRAENELLRADNMRCREALTEATCLFCGFSGDMSFGGPNFPKILFEQEHLKRETPATTDVGTPEETGTIVDLDFGWSKGREIGNNAPMKLSETANSDDSPP